MGERLGGCSLFIFVLWFDYFLYTDVMIDVAAQCKATKDVVVAAAATSSDLSWPTRGYYKFIPSLLVHMLAVLTCYVFILCLVRTHMIKFLYDLHIVIAMFLIY